MDYKITDTTLTAIANKIRDKAGLSNLITPIDMPTELNTIPSVAGYQNLLDQLVEETQTGVAVASFTDGANNIPTKKIICHINPTETGTGEKSPQNPYVIGGFTEANITQTDGQTPPIISKSYTVPFGQTVYGGTLNVTTGVLTVDKGYRKFNGSENWGSQGTIGSYIGMSTYGMKSGKEQDGNANMFPVVTMSNTGIVIGYNNTVIYALYRSSIPEVTDTNSWKTYLSTHNLEVVFPLETPQTIQLTPTEIKTLLGANNIYHDCNGDIDVTYRANGALYVQEHPITRGLMAARPTEQIQEQEES